MTNFILGTAGHIDHGKTALIKSLTGIDCDTHPEEKQRGITINLGFSHLNLPDGNSIGIIDVPGHHDFVNTMVAGAHGIDILMLVVAADSGIMPQTVEHFQIAQILGIKHGLVILTKIDLVDEESILIIENEIKDFLKNSFLDDCDILRVSAITGEGIELIKDHLMKLLGSIQKRSASEVFRMYIDRIFSVTGFGTVVTGSVFSGNITKNDRLYLLPTNKELRIRRMERHGIEVVQISPGNRVSLNLIGLNKDEFNKGMVLSDKIIQPTTILDAKLYLLQNVKNISVWSDVIFLTGTFKNQAKMHLLDKNKAEGGSSVIVQIHLTESCIIFRGDKYIIRSTSGLQTLGGGEVTDPYPLHHRRRTEKVVNQLKRVAEGDSYEYIFYEVRKRRIPLSLNNFSDEINLQEIEIQKSLIPNIPDDITAIKSDENTFLMLKADKEKIKANILKNISNFHKRNPFLEKGRTFDELMGTVDKSTNQLWKDVLKSILLELQSEKRLKQIEETWSLINHSVQLDDKELEQIRYIEDYFKKSEMHTPIISELIIAAKQKGINEKKMDQILSMLVARNDLYRVDDNYLHSSIVNKCRKKLLNFLSDHANGITVAAFRDLTGGNRKICLLMLNLFDTEGVTYRDGDSRKITERGKKILDENG
jgi:selenocysteine-specific elongation factor